ncbi:GntR family transcriptional regulator [Paenibacillus baekrokdamisoli]|uniref:GntR family transcriptional regulator n=1 Tax=Paenibacillus baekrokdamisoli TaxID=1712516 RepID=A0A3G9J980_9BACL|nr:GntR family transcriptional regulator [Paenibacillus baekrokdamisoli]MBB3072556.1 DNA-binding GntR family transcriptional regulator [Paenibacillus baekrokdamisoli]BBH22391.1 GntR family transcriptional regulator [Paenibacillus baekrokdamisoli]
MDVIPESALNETTYSRVCDKLRGDILSGVFKPGVRLRIVDLSTRYGVSQMPIREALQQLQGEGLVSLLPHKGASVREVNEKFVSDMYDIRMAIETMLVRNGVPFMKESDYNRLVSIEEQYEKASSEGELLLCLKLNESFHKIINNLAQNDEAIRIIDRHWGLIDSMRQIFGSNRGIDIANDHRMLLEALKNRDAEAAANITRDHVIKAKEDLIARIKATGKKTNS